MIPTARKAKNPATNFHELVTGGGDVLLELRPLCSFDCEAIGFALAIPKTDPQVVQNPEAAVFSAPHISHVCI
jgi:hypothetical protein